VRTVLLVSAEEHRCRRHEDHRAADGDYPNLVEVVGGHVAKAGYDYATEFLFGLDVILDGLERLLDR
jgi:hypothetical protein